MSSKEINQNNNLNWAEWKEVDIRETPTDEEVSESISELEREASSVDKYPKHLLATYMTEIGGYPRLSAEEEAAIWKTREKSDLVKVVNGHLKMVVAIVNKLSPHGQTAEGDFMDLVQAGNMGLLRAASTFDPNRGNRFSTHAFYWISTYVKSELANQRCGCIKKPAHVLAAFGVVTKVEERLAAALGRTPTEQELEVALDGIFADEKLDDLLRLKTTQVMSLDVDYGNGASNDDAESTGSVATLSNSTPDARYDEEVERQETADAVMQGIKAALPPRLQVLVCARFGLGEWKDMPCQLKEVANILAERGLTKKVLTQERVRQLQEEAIEILRNDPNMKALFGGGC